MNGKCGKKPPLYSLLKVLHREALLVSITCKLITSKNVTLHRRKQANETDAFVIDIWNNFDDGIIDANDVLIEVQKFTPH